MIVSINKIKAKRLKIFEKIKRDYTAALTLQQYNGKNVVVIQSLLSFEYKDAFLKEAWDTLVVDVPSLTHRLIYDSRLDQVGSENGKNSRLGESIISDEIIYRNNFFYLLQITEEQTLEDYSTTNGGKKINKYYLNRIVDSFKNAFYNKKLIYPILSKSLFKISVEVSKKALWGKTNVRTVRAILDYFLEILFHNAGFSIERDRLKQMLNNQSPIILPGNEKLANILKLSELSWILQKLENHNSFGYEKKMALIRLICSLPSVPINEVLKIMPQNVNFREASVRFRGEDFFISKNLLLLIKNNTFSNSKPCFRNQNGCSFSYQDLSNFIDPTLLEEPKMKHVTLGNLQKSHAFLLI